MQLKILTNDIGIENYMNLKMVPIWFEDFQKGPQSLPIFNSMFIGKRTVYLVRENVRSHVTNCLCFHQ